MKTIAVNAYPLRQSGGKSILDQFVRGVGRYSPHCRYIIFVYPGVRGDVEVENVEYIPVRQGRLAKALFAWQFFGFKNRLKALGIRADATISLANVNVRAGKDTPGFLYYHQAIPLYPGKWNPFRAGERGLWLYKTVFRAVVRSSLRADTQVFVQLACIKRRFSHVFGTSARKIHVVAPSALPPAKDLKGDTLDLNPDFCNFIYPATPFVYKNHRVLLDALRIVARRGGLKIKLYLTCTQEQLARLCPADTGSDGVQAVCLGYIGQQTLGELYRRADALLFPSRIESFGLPLLEASALGLPVLASDTDFAREVLGGYPGARYVPAGDPQRWAEAIEELAREKGVRYPLSVESRGDSWGKFFEIIHKNIE